MDDDAPRRQYDASGRRAAAERRREHVAGVAARLFAQHGWNGTTVALVAAEAGVSVELVTKSFDGKGGLFMAAFRSVGFGRRGTLQQAFEALHLEDEPDVEVRLDRFVEFASSIAVPMGPLVWVLAQGAEQDPLMGELVRSAQAGHAVVCEELVRLLATGTPAPDAVDEVYLLTRAETYQTLAEHRGWTPERYTAWLRRSLRAAVDGWGAGPV
ncbi:TetR/AcrR family transcriptional regulator [Nocardioides KLBMP 9356]|uniref:TetR/AcrR family transcriptional regulator n=1 Tax=Nocardioides potassii TaxID=2911371 RepID=A0ABS9HFH5_9ACTN|nr:TetR/AcrR family transcriptional regulator [Nocardioides potassii]MCF6378858.1 TetR/AcrR family transcriptional regulator [Nocardioides potassii]